MQGLWDLLKAAAGVLGAASAQAVGTYSRLLVRSMWIALATAVVLIPLPVIGVLRESPFLISAYLVIVGLLTVANLLLAIPIVIVGQIALAEFAPLRRSVNFILTILLWFLIAALYVYLVPVWNNPSLIPGVLLILGILAITSVVFSTRILSPRLLVPAMLFALAFMTRAFLFPHSSSGLVNLFGGVDRKVSGWLERPRQVDPVAVDWFGPAGEPLLWYVAFSDCAFEFFDRPGYHPKVGLKLEKADQTIRKRWEECRKKATAAVMPVQRPVKSQDAPPLKTPPSAAPLPERVLQTVDAHGFTFELRKATLEGGESVFELVVISRGDGQKLAFLGASKLFDIRGNVYSPNLMMLEGKRIGSYPVPLTQEMPTRGLLSFSQIPGDAQIAALIIKCWFTRPTGPGSEEGDNFEIRFMAPFEPRPADVAAAEPAPARPIDSGSPGEPEPGATSSVPPVDPGSSGEAGRGVTPSTPLDDSGSEAAASTMPVVISDGTNWAYVAIETIERIQSQMIKVTFAVENRSFDALELAQGNGSLRTALIESATRREFSCQEAANSQRLLLRHGEAGKIVFVCPCPPDGGQVNLYARWRGVITAAPSRTPYQSGKLMKTSIVLKRHSRASFGRRSEMLFRS